MTFFKEAFQVNRKSYPERVRSALFHAIKKTAANLDACVKVPGKDFSRKRKLPLQTILLMLIGMGGGSLSKELYDWFGYTSSTATASAFVQQRNKIRSKAIEMIFNEFVASAMPTMTFRGYRLFAVDGSDLRLPSDPTNDFSLSKPCFRCSFPIPVFLKQLTILCNYRCPLDTCFCHAQKGQLPQK